MIVPISAVGQDSRRGALARMGKNGCFAQRGVVFRQRMGKKCVFYPTVALYSRGWVSKMACFGARKGVFPGSGTQNGMFWGTEGCISRVGNPKWHVLGHGRVYLQGREPKMACFGARRADGEGGGSWATKQQGTGAAGHRRRSIRDPAAPARALRGALLKALLAPGRCPEPAERWQNCLLPDAGLSCITWQFVLRAQFWQKCAHWSIATCFSRANLAKMRALEHVIRQFGIICANNTPETVRKQ